jgi:hypothetical protein
MSDPALPFDWRTASDAELNLIATESGNAEAIRGATTEIVARQLQLALDTADAGDALGTAHAVLEVALVHAVNGVAVGCELWREAVPCLTWLVTALETVWQDSERLPVALDLAEAFCDSAIVRGVVRHLRG